MPGLAEILPWDSEFFGVGKIARLAAPLLGLAVRRSVARDLRTLKQVLEGRLRPSGR